MAKIIYARRTGGGRCCSFYGRNGVRSMKRNDASSMSTNAGMGTRAPAPEEVGETTTPTKTITNGNIKSNKQVEAQKKQMNQVIRKLETVNVKRKNISFDI